MTNMCNEGYFTPHYLVVEEEPDSKTEAAPQQDYDSAGSASDAEEWAGEEYIGLL